MGGIVEIKTASPKFVGYKNKRGMLSSLKANIRIGPS